MPTIHRDYSSTVRDLKSLVLKEASDAKREALNRNLDLMASEIERMRQRTESLSGLEAKVEGLTWLVRGVIVAGIVEFIVAVGAAMVMRTHT